VALRSLGVTEAYVAYIHKAVARLHQGLQNKFGNVKYYVYLCGVMKNLWCSYSSFLLLHLRRGG
jgi:hypothetical protein